MWGPARPAGVAAARPPLREGRRRPGRGGSLQDTVLSVRLPEDPVRARGLVWKDGLLLLLQEASRAAAALAERGPCLPCPQCRVAPGDGAQRHPKDAALPVQGSL